MKLELAEMKKRQRRIYRRMERGSIPEILREHMKEEKDEKKLKQRERRELPERNTRPS